MRLQSVTSLLLIVSICFPVLHGQWVEDLYDGCGVTKTCVGGARTGYQAYECVKGMVRTEK